MLHMKRFPLGVCHPSLVTCVGESKSTSFKRWGSESGTLGGIGINLDNNGYLFLNRISDVGSAEAFDQSSIRNWLRTAARLNLIRFKSYVDWAKVHRYGYVIF